MASVGGEWDVGDVYGSFEDTDAIIDTSNCTGSPVPGSGMDALRGYLYWTCYSSTDGSIYKTSYDTTEQIVTGLTAPGGVCVDSENEYMFYGSRTEAEIYRADLSGNNAVLLVSGHNFASCEISDGTVYFVTYKDGEFMSMTQDGGNVTSIYDFADDDSASVALRDLAIVNVGDSTAHAYITDSLSNNVYRTTLTGSGEKTLITSITQPTGIKYSNVIDSLIIASKEEEEIVAYSLKTDEITVLYTGSTYKSIELCGEPCHFLGSSFSITDDASA